MGTHVLLSADTVLTAGDESIGRPLDITVDTAGRIIVADMVLNQLIVLDTNGAVTKRLGREGAGPGEFRIPRSLFVAGDTVHLVDALNQRLMAFHLGTGGARTYAATPGVGNAAVSFNASGDAMMARSGRLGALAQRLDPDGVMGRMLGALKVPESMTWDFAQIKADLTAGRVAEVLRNTSYPVLADDGSAWVILLVDGVIERYTPHDSLRWSAALDDSLISRLRDGLYALNRADTTPGRFVFPSVVTAAQSICGDLWVLLREPDDRPATLLVFADDGALERRITVNGAHAARAFSVDPKRRRIWLLDTSEGTLLRAALPGGVCASSDL
ncbi:MAG: 6-bladed beta-propeller [Gemmatimonadales bacterium]